MKKMRSNKIVLVTSILLSELISCLLFMAVVIVIGVSVSY